MRPILLASRSPRRKTILQFAGIPFRVVKPRGIQETRRAGEKPSRFVTRLALEKATEVARRFPKSLCLGADTVVVHRGRVFGKPRNREEGARMLRALSGKVHEVWTGVAFVGKGGREKRAHAEKTRVTFRRLSSGEMKAYLRTQEPYDKAGGYAIQGTARAWIKDWEGDYFNVMGLPLKWVVREANRLGKAGV